MTRSGAGRPVPITGGAGFVGSNLAERPLRAGTRVLVLDNLSRQGAEHNLRRLRETCGDLVQPHIRDVRDRRAVEEPAGRWWSIFHFAARVAVTKSLVDPVDDFESNLLGTLNVLAAVREQTRPPALLFTSTDKVYGNLHDVDLVPSGDRYVPQIPFEQGISQLHQWLLEGVQPGVSPVRE